MEKCGYDTLWGMVNHSTRKTGKLSLWSNSSLPVASELGVSCYSFSNFIFITHYKIQCMLHNMQHNLLAGIEEHD